MHAEDAGRNIQGWLTLSNMELCNTFKGASVRNNLYVVLIKDPVEAT